jgi:hypothetical protein
MQVHSFRGPGRVFAFTEAADGANLPAAYAPWTPFKVLDVHRDEPQPGFDVNECLEDIEAHGFHLTDAHVRITERAL